MMGRVLTSTILLASISCAAGIRGSRPGPSIAPEGTASVAPHASDRPSETSPVCPRAWLLMIDDSSAMSPRAAEVRALAEALVEPVGPADPIRIHWFDQRETFFATPWATKEAAAFALGEPRGSPTPDGRVKALSRIVDQSLGVFDSLPVSTTHRRTLILLTDGNGADESELPALVARLKEQRIRVAVLWLPSRMMEEQYERSRTVVDTLAGAEGRVVALERPTTDVSRVAKDVMAQFGCR